MTSDIRFGQAGELGWVWELGLDEVLGCVGRLLVHDGTPVIGADLGEQGIAGNDFGVEILSAFKGEFIQGALAEAMDRKDRCLVEIEQSPA